VSLSSDGLSIVYGSWVETVRVWDVSTGKEKAKLEGHGDQVTSVSFSPDGLSIVSGSWDETVHAWDVSMGEEKAKLEGYDDQVLSCH
jgi:WD40 repeat protein